MLSGLISDLNKFCHWEIEIAGSHLDELDFSDYLPDWVPGVAA